MNKSPLRDIPKLSNIVIHRVHSLFNVEALLSLQQEAQPKRVFVRATPISRWNE